MCRQILPGRLIDNTACIQPPMPYAGGMGKKILFVEDTADWRSMVQTFLEVKGYEVLTAKDASEAMARSDGIELGLIIVDLNLGGESGMMLMRFLKRNNPEVPILLFTGMDHDDATITAMLRQGADRYLQKGSLEELLKAVQLSFKG